MLLLRVRVLIVFWTTGNRDATMSLPNQKRDYTVKGFWFSNALFCGPTLK
jgi:hypothetical protein